MVYNIISERGNAIPNQFVIKTDNYPRTYVFQSYQSTIAKWSPAKDNRLHLSTRWGCSNTTSKYLYRFIREYTPFHVKSKKDVLRLIDEDKFVVDLNYNETVF
jgi:hypothetical protein